MKHCGKTIAIFNDKFKRAYLVILSFITGRPLLFESKALQIYAQTVFTLSFVINRAEFALVTKIMKHEYMRVCNHKNRINIMLCLLNSAVVDPRLQT